MEQRGRAALSVLLFFLTRSVSGIYPRAQNVTWTSVNFKTVLEWEPKPSANYSYTVEFSRVGADRQRTPHCIRSSEIKCDLSSALTDLKAVYTAEILSEPPLGATSDLTEFPYTSSPRFCPYEDTIIGKPDFKLEVSKDKRKTTLYVTDPLTALFQDNTQLSVRDIFSDALQYKVIYRKNRSTGKKVHISKSNVIELSNLDRGQSYCFTVQAFIPSRSLDKQLGQLSQTQCSKDDDKSITDEFSWGAIATVISLILLLIAIIIGVTVFCCKRKKKALKSEKESSPLRAV